MPEANGFDLTQPAPVLVTCATGTGSFLAEEIRALGLPVIDPRETYIETAGSLHDCMRMNLELSTGLRVLYELRTFSAHNAMHLYSKTVRLPWETLIPIGEQLTITSRVDNPTIRNWRYANLRCKDAIVDRIRNQTGARPDSGPGQENVVIHLYWIKSRCRLYVDTTGIPLSRRGYRLEPWQAPMQETLAAAVVRATGWSPPTPFVNPMCGSGTLAIEAALRATCRAPGSVRDNFAFMHVQGYDGDTWLQLQRESSERVTTAPSRIVASDVAPEAIEVARRNARQAGVEDQIDFHVCDFAETPLPPGPGCVLLNPEYGERMGNAKDLEATYNRIGDFFKQHCKGYTGHVFTGNLVLAKRIGLRSNRRQPFYNGNIECRLISFEVYEGTRRPHS